MNRASWLFALTTVGALVAAACSQSGDVGDYIDTTPEAGGPSFTPPPGSDAGDATLGPTSPLLACEGTSCPAPYATCGDTSSVRCGANLLTDKNNCGACGHACPNDDLLHTSSRCVEGTCIAECQTDNNCSVNVWKDCNGILDDGCEAPVSDDPNNCGACGNKCAAGEPCVNGACGCGAGKTYCSGCNILTHPVTCVDLQNDNLNCGTCNKKCSTKTADVHCAVQPPATGFGCGDGLCAKLGCIEGFGDCDKDLSKGCSSNGCEVQLGTDPKNCGACGNVCAAGEECRDDGSGPQCVTPCEASGKAICPSGCADLVSDPINCGACGTICTVPLDSNAKPECRKGICQTKCADGFGDCDGNPANGCETTLASDPTSCGACGVNCDYAAGQPCIEGKCLMVECDAGVTR